MSSQDPAREASRGGHETAGAVQNAAAYETPSTRPSNTAAPPSPSDTKRSNAAQLARELGSSSPWSETFISQGYGTLSRSSSSAEPTDRQESEDTNHTVSRVEQDLDPPPAYSRIPVSDNLQQAYNSSAENMNTASSTGPATHDTVETQPLTSTDVEQEQSIQHGNPDVETPLLAQSSPTYEDRRYFRWIRQRKMKKRRYCRVLCAVILFAIITSILASFLVGYYGGELWFRRPPTKHGQPFVDTGPVYERHETTEDIYGAYKLSERLVLTTGTGAINVEVDPQPGDDPAVLILSSDIGSVTVRMTDGYLRRRKRAQRTIHTQIRSLTGSISAEILLGYGGSALVETTTGVQALSILTYGVGPGDNISSLTTTSGTGTQKVVLTSLESEHKRVSSIHGVHRSFGTASLDIVYSPSWVGQIHAAASPFGSVSVTGDNLKYTQKNIDNIVAYRGTGRNLTLTEVISEGTGSASFKCSKRDGTGSVL